MIDCLMEEYVMLRFSEEGYLSFICPICWSVIRVHGVKQPVSKYTNDVFIDHDPYLFECPHCHHLIPKDSYRIGTDVDRQYIHRLTPFSVDPELDETIAILNRKGYKTYYSCSSHSNTDIDFYIMLEIPDQVIHDFPVPNDFNLESRKEDVDNPYREIHSDYYIIRVDFNTVSEHIDDEEFRPLLLREWKNVHTHQLEEIKRWVYNLPSLTCYSSMDKINIVDITVQKGD